jgi:hypothetical protein
MVPDAVERYKNAAVKAAVVFKAAPSVQNQQVLIKNAAQRIGADSIKQGRYLHVAWYVFYPHLFYIEIIKDTIIGFFMPFDRLGPKLKIATALFPSH